MTIWNWITLDGIKTFAAVVQAFGFLLGAVLAYRFARELEHHKYKIRVTEIKFTKFHEKRLSTLESISAIQGKLLYETSELLYIGGWKERVPRNDNEDRESYLERSFAPRHVDITAALFELRQSQEIGIVYLPDPIYIKLTRFREAISELVQTYTLRMLERRKESAEYAQIWNEADAKFKAIEAERLEIVNITRTYIGYDDDVR